MRSKIRSLQIAQINSKIQGGNFISQKTLQEGCFSKILSRLTTIYLLHVCY
jgi:hypothetical protein